MTLPLLAVELRSEPDIVLARQRARQIAAHLGLDPQEQTRLATAVSELARNAHQYAGGGRVEFRLQDRDSMLVVTVSDEGPGIPHLTEVLEGRYESPTGMGIGIAGSRRLVDRFDVETAPGRGTRIVLGKQLPRLSSSAAARIAGLAHALAASAPESASFELREQNRELLRALSALQTRQLEVERLNGELAETNRGVLALYGELDEKAAELARASELKSQFLSDMSHELRTPLHSIINITRLLLDRLDGPLTPEQERQVVLIRESAVGLSQLVNDLLDLARIEAGKTTLRPSVFQLAELLATLRGVFRPLVPSEAVSLVFADVPPLPALETDEARVSQILRNLISNALKFTDAGEVVVAAAAPSDGMVRISVTDTGVGIAPEDQSRIFEPYVQLDNPLQRPGSGTGLGLPLSRRLAMLLGGTLTVESEPGRGSRFTLAIPPILPALRGTTALELEHA
jgi:signal transduction histidine kinase